MTSSPRTARVRWSKAYRVINSRYPPIDVFERIAEPDDWDHLLALEQLTNPRLREELGQISLVPRDERVSGPGASWVMGAFTHVGRPSRFSDGTFGVYYAARLLESAVRETAFHFGRFLLATREPLGTQLHVRVLVSSLLDHVFHDVRRGFPHLHLPDDYGPSQAFAKALRIKGSSGLVYTSVRHPGNACLAVFRPKAITRPRQGPHLVYHFDGRRIDRWLEIGSDAWNALPLAPSHSSESSSPSGGAGLEAKAGAPDTRGAPGMTTG